MSVLGFQYAEALFDLANEKKCVDKIKDNFGSFIEASSAELMDFMNHPKIQKSVKKEMIDDLKLEDLLTHFLYVVIDHDRYEYLHEIFEEYENIIHRQNQVMNVNVYSKKKLTKAEKERLISKLEKKHNRKIELKNIVDETIVGGLKVEYEGYVLDDTINNYLQNLKATLKS